jgi:hypothetical protein
VKRYKWSLLVPERLLFMKIFERIKFVLILLLPRLYLFTKRLNQTSSSLPVPNNSRCSRPVRILFLCRSNALIYLRLLIWSICLALDTAGLYLDNHVLSPGVHFSLGYIKKRMRSFIRNEIISIRFVSGIV